MEGIELLDGMLLMLPNEGHLLPHLDLVPSECHFRLLAPGHQILKPLCQQLRVLPPDELVIDQLVNAIQPHDQLNAQCSMHEGCLLLVLLVHIDLIVGEQDMAHTLHSFLSCMTRGWPTAPAPSTATTTWRPSFLRIPGCSTTCRFSPQFYPLKPLNAASCSLLLAGMWRDSATGHSRGLGC